jgi:hypothetical protein
VYPSAREQGLTDEMVEAIPNFRESSLFSPAEKAALRLSRCRSFDLIQTIPVTSSFELANGQRTGGGRCGKGGGATPNAHLNDTTLMRRAKGTLMSNEGSTRYLRSHLESNAE